MKRPPPQLAGRLRAAADELLGPDGAPSVDDMAGRTGIPRATLYYYFSGREELLDFLLLDKVEQIGKAIRAVAVPDLQPAAGLEAVLSAVAETIAAHPALCTMLLTRLPLLSPGDVLAVAVARSVLQPLCALLESGAAAGAFEVADPELTAHALYGAIAMAALSQIARDGTVDASRVRSALIPRLLAAVRR